MRRLSERLDRAETLAEERTVERTVERFRRMPLSELIAVMRQYWHTPFLETPNAEIQRVISGVNARLTNCGYENALAIVRGVYADYPIAEARRVFSMELRQNWDRNCDEARMSRILDLVWPPEDLPEGLLKNLPESLGDTLC